MVELRHRDAATLDLGFGGDTLNAAIYLARAGGGRIAADYATALGDDPYSAAMIEFIAREGVGTTLIARLQGKLPGLYAIRLDPRGERLFHYWRGESAARQMFAGGFDPDRIEALTGYDMLFVTGITLAILDPASRVLLLDTLARARRRGARIAFDDNYRPRLWPSAEAARDAIAAILPLVDIALPSFDDATTLYGDEDAARTARRLRKAGVAEIAVKDGASGCCLAWREGEARVPAERAEVVDSTAAGDSFNGAYLAARLLGRTPREAATLGNRLAATVIRHPGAIIAAAAMPALGLAGP